ncbi:beta-hexosaminidase [Geofilum rubicundum JCM 15548]|uniref:beta-N-acetylhexosaminidase n=1 Tax=Geofilum rubicundum JCM 15548 TaxID=1236989 RepID=A0A0E9LV78_9BACT|nr:beta-hexosaminidase [Geofilum rubicundum JCM 15548]
MVLEKTGEGFVMDEETSIHFKRSDKDLQELADFFTAYVGNISRYSLSHNSKSGKAVHLEIINNPQLGDEGYEMTVASNLIVIKANNRKGIFWGMQSLFQTLTSVRTNEVLKVPGMRVVDYPRFKWRGMMLDVSRHFFGPDVIKQYIDLMASYKLNVFHWHLVDDGGWRIEIKQYPKLTETGAWRVDRLDKVWSDREPARAGEPATYGGFYTQDQIREIVAYARLRNITIVPEIELPGHSVAALAAYPEYSCSQIPQLVNTGGVYPKNIQSSYCPGNEAVFVFLQNVLLEVMELFPSEFIHIGGDEVDKSWWKKCERCQQRMNAEGLTDEDELQSYMIRRMDDFLVTHNRRLIGWDEILEGGLASGATVMSWRGEAGGVAAAQMGHDVVMTPGSPCYFDHYQAGPEGEPVAIGGMNTLKHVYNYEPVPAELSIDEAKYVLGAQANVWTEFIPTVEHLEYMILPRMLLWPKCYGRLLKGAIGKTLTVDCRAGIFAALIKEGCATVAAIPKWPSALFRKMVSFWCKWTVK